MSVQKTEEARQVALPTHRAQLVDAHRERLARRLVAEEVSQRKIVSNDAPTSTAVAKFNAKYDIINTKNNKGLERETGWSMSGQTKWAWYEGNRDGVELDKAGSQGGAIKCGDTFAMKLGGKCYYQCQGSPQKLGINMCGEDCTSSHYEWEFKGCTPGEEIKLNQAVTLYNKKRGDALVYANQVVPKVMDICWANNVSTKNTCTLTGNGK
jgi:hypothetical protein